MGCDCEDLLCWSYNLSARAPSPTDDVLNTAIMTSQVYGLPCFSQAENTWRNESRHAFGFPALSV